VQTSGSFLYAGGAEIPELGAKQIVIGRGLYVEGPDASRLLFHFL
jgi:hypothetical protein